MRDDLPDNILPDVESELALPELLHFDYAIVRVVPRVERGEFLNVGAMIFCPTQGFLDCKIELDRARLTAFAPSVDADDIESYLQTIERICCGGKKAGVIGQMSQRERWHWLVAPRSTMIQISPVHAGLCHNLAGALDDLFDKMVRVGK